MKITLDLLNDMPSGATACMDGRKWFAATFPNGAGLDEFWATCPFVDWKIWFTVNYVPMAEVCNLAYKFAGQAMRFAGIKDYADNVGADNTRAAARAAADAAYRADGGAARAAARAAAYAAYTTARAAADAAYRADGAAARAAARAAADAAYARAAADVADADADAAAYAAYTTARAAADAAADACVEQVEWCRAALVNN